MLLEEMKGESCLRRILGPLHMRAEHLKHVGWAPYQVVSYVNWCGHAQEIIPVPLEDGRVTSLLSRDPFRDLRDDRRSVDFAAQRPRNHRIHPETVWRVEERVPPMFNPLCRG